MQDLEYASKEKVVGDHSVIDEAIKERAEVSPIESESLNPLLKLSRDIQYSPFLLAWFTVRMRQK